MTFREIQAADSKIPLAERVSGWRSVALAALLALASCGVPVQELYVAPDGDDTNPGTKTEPFATLERARDEIRKSDAGIRKGTTVHLRGGVYHLAKTLTWGAGDGGAADAPVIYRAYRDERPILRGGVPITGFEPHQGQMLKSDMKSQGLGGVRFRQLFFDGRRQQLARYPNLDPRKPFESGWAFVDAEPIPAEQLGGAGAKRMLRVAAADLRPWAKPTDGEVSIFPSHEWWNNIAPITAFDRDRRILTVGRNCSYDIAPGDRYFVQGPMEELDAPGEWHLDAEEGTLYFWPPEPIADRQVYAPRLKTMLEIGPGCAHVTFRGLTLEFCEGTAVTVRNATNCLIAGCTDQERRGLRRQRRQRGRRRGKWRGRLRYLRHRQPRHHVDGRRREDAHPRGQLRREQPHHPHRRLPQAGLRDQSSRAPAIASPATTSTTCRVSACSSAGQNHVIELNHIHHVCLETMDTGAIYGGSLNWLSAHGTIIRHNFIHDVIGRSGKAGKWLSPYFAWGIYLDWTAMGVTVTGNIVARTPRAGIMVHDGRDNVIENNIIVDCGTGRYEHGPTSQIEFSGWDTGYGWWKREIDNWCKQYDAVKDLPAWKNVASLRDPRTVPLPDGRTMQRNVARLNILSWNDPQPQAFRFRNLSFEHNPCDSNLLWHGGQPIKTGQFKVGEIVGPDIAPPNAGFEGGAPGQIPAGWTWHIRPSTHDTAIATEDRPHSGARCLRLEGIPDPAKAGNAQPEGESWARIPSLKSAEIAVEPGKVYRIAACFRAAAPDTRVELGAQAYRKELYSWQHVESFPVGMEWSRHECVFRFPAPELGGHPEMKKCYIRIRLPGERGLAWADDVQVHEVVPMDEWAAWQSLGMDRHSLVAEPLLR